MCYTVISGRIHTWNWSSYCDSNARNGPNIRPYNRSISLNHTIKFFSKQFLSFFFSFLRVWDADLGADEESDAVAQDADSTEQHERPASLPQTRREHVEQRRVRRRHQRELQFNQD